MCLVAKKAAWETAIIVFKYYQKWMIFCKIWNPKSCSFWENGNFVILCSKFRSQNWAVLLEKVHQKWTIQVVWLMLLVCFNKKWSIKMTLNNFFGIEADLSKHYCFDCSKRCFIGDITKIIKNTQYLGVICLDWWRVIIAYYFKSKQTKITLETICRSHFKHTCPNKTT